MTTPQTIKREGNAPHLESVIPTPKHASLFLSYWTSPEALAERVEAMGDGKNNWSDSAWDTDRPDFHGTVDMAEALRLCRDGWQDGIERVARLRDLVNAANPTGPRVTRWDVAGAIPSVARVLAGNPMHMKRIDTTRLRRKPIVTLASNVTNSYTVNADAITNRAAVVAAIVDKVGAAGFACEVITYNHSEAPKASFSVVTACVAKESSAPADIGRLAFALGHAGFFRRICFAAKTHDKFTRPLKSILGIPAELDRAAANERNVFILPNTQANETAFASERACAELGLPFLIDALRKQGCPAFPSRAAA